MKNKLEQLLNSLIEKGWKPRGLETKRFDGEMYYAEIFEHYSNGTMFFDGVEYSIRQIVSKESGLWQFVCENGMCTAGERPHRGKFYEELFPDYEAQTYANNMIIESALCDEDKLEEFLLNSIKLD